MLDVNYLYNEVRKSGEKYNVKELMRYLSFCNTNCVESAVCIERHHVLPRSIFPEHIKDKKNIARLTAANHFKAHVMLINVFASKSKAKCVTAYRFMSGLRMKKGEDIELHSILYEKLRIESSIAATVLHTGRKHTEETKKKMSVSGIAAIKKYGNQWAIWREDNKNTPEYKKMTHMTAVKREANKKASGYTASEETRKRISEAGKGRKRTEETKERMKIAAKQREAKKKAEGYTLSDIGKENVSNALIEYWQSEKGKQTIEVIRKKNTGKKRTEETKKKMSESAKKYNAENERKPVSEETRNKLSKAAKGSKRTEETKKKMSESAKEWYKNNKRIWTKEMKEKSKRTKARNRLKKRIIAAKIKTCVLAHIIQRGHYE